MATTYRTKQGETLDLICWRHYGLRRGIVERVLNANYGLANQPPVLPMGLSIVLPDIPQPTQTAPIQKLWD